MPPAKASNSATGTPRLFARSLAAAMMSGSLNATRSAAGSFGSPPCCSITSAIEEAYSLA